MAEKKEAKTSAKKEKTGEQSVVNIGMVGHVDHGKCIDINEQILLNNELVTGKELINIAEKQGRLIEENQNEKIFKIPNLNTYCLDKELCVQRKPAFLFMQNYKGLVKKIKTKTGREITLTKSHPLLVNKQGKLQWTKSDELKRGDFIAVAKKLKLKQTILKLPKNYLKKLSEKYIVKKRGHLIILKHKNRGKITKFKDVKIDRNFIRFLAFLSAEGTVCSNKLMLCQRNYPEMRDTVLGYLSKAGLTIKQYSDKDFQISCKPFVEYLEYKFSLSSQRDKAKIPPWIIGVSKELKQEFLQWFFTFESNANLHSGQIALSQAKKQDINTLVFLLNEFGIFSHLTEIKKSATNAKKPKKRTYYLLSISGRDNLENFIKKIGFFDKNKEKEIQEYINKIGGKKKSNIIFPINLKKLNCLVGLAFKDKRRNAVKQRLKKDRKWYKNLEEVRKRGVVTYNFIEEIVSEAKKEIENMEILIKQNKKELTQIMHIVGISYTDIEKNTKISKSQIVRIVNGRIERKQQLEKIKKFCINTAKDRIKKIGSLINYFEKIINAPILFDKIISIKKVKYNDYLIDLHVPEFHNFFAGHGGILCHNTSLTQQLTGKWTDTHSEELKRGISIRLGYADTNFYKCPKCKDFEKYTSKEKCPKCDSKTEKIRRVSFVDAPGHETLMTTMLSGAALMHGAILVIAANEECPQPRTREHLTALKISGIENIIVAQNKVDLVSKEDAEKNYKQIKAFLETEGYKDSPIIPISANFGGNIDLLIEAMEKVIKTPCVKENLPLKMYCARSFDINKPGTLPEDLRGGVIGGSIIQGTIKPKDEIEITPGFESGKLTTKVVSVSAENGILKDAKAGGLIAIGTMLDPSVTQNDRMRGQVIAKAGTVPEPTKDITLEFHFFERLIDEVDQEIKIGDLLVLTVGTLTAVGSVTNKKKDEIEMKLKNSVVIEKGQKVAISKRDKAFWRLVAYGISK